MTKKSTLILGVDIKDCTNILCQNLVVQNIAKIYDIRFIDHSNFNLSFLKIVTFEGSIKRFYRFKFFSVLFATGGRGDLLYQKNLEVDSKKRF